MADGNPSLPLSVSLSVLRSIRGPVLLVALGALFMIDYSGGVSFGRTWPVLLIVFGLLKLGEHLGAGNA
jgi:hypothetical protein